MNPRVPFGPLSVDPLTFAGALQAIDALVAAGHGGSIFTPNVDHVVQAEINPFFREAYRRADVCLADGMPLLWAARLRGRPLPAKVSGSDLVPPLMEQAARNGWRVYLLGGAPGVAEAAARKLRERGVNVVGVDAPFVRDPTSAGERGPVIARIRAVRPHLLLVAFGAPKQELWIDHARPELGPTVALGIGASLDFVAGTVRRAPAWMSRFGLEWLYRLAQEPRRLWRRYLLRDPAFVAILVRYAWRARRRSSAPPR